MRKRGPEPVASASAEVETARDIRNGVDHIWLVSRSGIIDIGNEDLPPGSRLVPKPYSATQIIKTLRELTRAV
jgi:hypothetical protein